MTTSAFVLVMESGYLHVDVKINSSGIHYAVLFSLSAITALGVAVQAIMTSDLLS